MTNDNKRPIFGKDNSHRLIFSKTREAMSMWFAAPKLNSAWGDTRQLKTVARGNSGVIMGASDGQPLIDTSMSPVAVLGPCCSGKGTSFVVPTLLTWRESAIVADVHGELYGLTEHWRRTGAKNEVRRLAFGDPSSPDTFNFLEVIPRGAASELADIQALAAALLGDGQDNGDYYWHHHAQSLLTLFIIAARQSLIASLHDVQCMVDDNGAFVSTIATFRDLIADSELGRMAKAAATAYLDLAEVARAAVREMVTNSLSVFASPVVARNTRRSSFDLAELRDGKAAMTLYLSFATHELGQLRPLIRAFLAQVARHGAEERRRQQAVHRLLLLLDDCLALGRLPFLESSLAYLPGYGIKALLTIQNLAQLNQVYGTDTLWKQCAIRTVLPVNDLVTATAVAEEIAGIVALADQQAAGTKRSKPPIMPITPDELLRLGKRDAIILGAAAKPIFAATLPYYEDAGLLALVAAGNADPLMSTTEGA